MTSITISLLAAAIVYVASRLYRTSRERCTVTVYRRCEACGEFHPERSA